MGFDENQQEQILEAIKEAEEEKKAARKADKLSKLQEKADSCNPCDKGVVIETALKVCKMADKFMGNKMCNRVHDDVVLEKINTEDYLRKMKGLCGKDKQAKSVIQSLLDGINK